MTATALRVACRDKFLPNSDVSFWFRIVAYAVASKTTIVTVLTPPAVPTGEPPINISNKQRIAVVSVKFSCGTVATPAVLVVMDWKREICILSNKEYPCKVKGLLYSKVKIATASPTIKAAVADSTILLCKVNLWKHFHLRVLYSFNTRKTSHHTI